MLTSLWERHRPPASDWVLAVAFTVLGQLVTWGRLDEPRFFHGPRAANAALDLVLTGAIAWRRRAPLHALGVVLVVYCLSDVVVRHDVAALSGFVPLIVLTACAGYSCARRDALVAAGLGVVGLLTITLAEPSLRAPDNLAYDLVFLLGPWLAARGLREREDRASQLGAELAVERTRQDALRDEVLAAERARIARELHDIVAHSVSVMVIQLGAARLRLAEGPAAVEPTLLAAEEVGRQALAELRRLLDVLRPGELPSGAAGAAPPLPPQPGLPQLDALIKNARSTGLDVDVVVEGETVELPPGLDLTAYRIVQEALTNTMKHGSAHRAQVRLRYGATLDLEIVDDGRATAARNAGGQGLVGIRERVALFGGRSEAGVCAGGGWRVAAELPLPHLETQGR